MARRSALLACGVAATLSACSFAPHYQVPSTPPVPAAFKEAGPWTPAAPATASLTAAWWTAYDDPVLTGFEQRIAGSNPTLASALARYDQAQAFLAEAESGEGPHVEIDANATRNRQSDHRPLRSANQPSIYSADTLLGAFSYELDLWGRVRNAVAAGRAAAQASADDVAGIKLLLEGQLADQYIALRGFDQQLRLYADAVAAYRQADDLTKRRFAGGIASGLDVARSGAQLSEAKAQYDDVLAQRALVEHAIASLIGAPASSFTVAVADLPMTVPATPPGVPSTLVQRRPDIAAAERRVFAANAEIGVAKAAFFPAITLGASGGFQNTGGPGFLTAPNTLWSIGPGAVLTLLDGGRRRARLAGARAIWAAATADYRGAVLQAFQEVEDNLALMHHLGSEVVAEDSAAGQAGTAQAISLNRYVAGATTYLDVVTAQTTALRTQRTALDLHTRQLQTSVRLIRALGGGWQPGSPGAAPAITTASALR